MNIYTLAKQLPEGWVEMAALQRNRHYLGALPDLERHMVIHRMLACSKLHGGHTAVLL